MTYDDFRCYITWVEVEVINKGDQIDPGLSMIGRVYVYIHCPVPLYINAY